MHNIQISHLQLPYLPLLWLAGLQVPLTASANKFCLSNYILNNHSHFYQEITGTHIEIMSEANVAKVIDFNQRKLKISTIKRHNEYKLRS